MPRFVIKRNPKEFIITVVNEKISKCNENKVDVNENSLRVFGNIDHFMGTMRECNECQELLVADTENLRNEVKLLFGTTQN